MRQAARHTRTIAAAVTALAAFAAVAVAFWSAPGGGTSQARLDEPRPITLGPGVPGAQLYPGGSASVATIATNPNPFVIHVDALRLDAVAGTGGFEVDADHAGCDLATIGFTAQDNGGSGWTLPPRTGDTDGTLQIDMDAALTMASTGGNACQGAVFVVHLLVGDAGT